MADASYAHLRFPSLENFFGLNTSDILVTYNIFIPNSLRNKDLLF